VILTNLLRTFGKIVEKGEQSFSFVYWSRSYRSFQGVGYMESTIIHPCMGNAYASTSQFPSLLPLLRARSV
jgi:hypothetical protein